MKKGFTLLEIVIAITLIGIISAIVLPNFTNTSDKARLKSDIQSAQIIQSALDLYNVEENDALSSGDFDTIVSELCDKNYLKQSEYEPQTNGAKFIIDFDKDIIKLDISSTPNCEELFEELSEQEKLYVTK